MKNKLKNVYIYIENNKPIKTKTCFNKDILTFGQLIFTTSMVGYQETITDPSYANQIIIMSYPMIGNYGINNSFNQSGKIYASAMIVNEIDENCDFAKFVNKNNIPLIKEVDTRNLINIAKQSNYPNCVISTKKQTKSNLIKFFNKVNTNLADKISVKTHINIDGKKQNGKKIAVVDFGVKTGIIDNLKQYFQTITICPFDTKIDYLLKNKFDCVLFSNGSGDPAKLTNVIKNIQDMIGKINIYGICLGHQLISISLGCKTKKMDNAHRGSNHPVINLQNGKIIITSQNHGYVVDNKNIPNDVEITYKSACDNTIEGIKSKKYNIQSVQFHPEGCAGPEDANIIFKEWFNN